MVLSRYLEGRVGQQVYFLSVLSPEALSKRLQTRRLQAITGEMPVRETIMRWYRHRGIDLPEEYMLCHCGKELETHEHFMQSEQYREIDGPLVRDQESCCSRRVQKYHRRWRGKWGKKGIAPDCGTL